MTEHILVGIIYGNIVRYTCPKCGAVIELHEHTKETSVCEKCIKENNNCESHARGAIEMYCPGYAIWNFNGESVLGPKTGKNICPFDKHEK